MAPASSACTMMSGPPPRTGDVWADDVARAEAPLQVELAEIVLADRRLDGRVGDRLVVVAGQDVERDVEIDILRVAPWRRAPRGRRSRRGVQRAGEGPRVADIAAHDDLVDAVASRSICARMSSPGESLKVARSALSRPPSAEQRASPRAARGRCRAEGRGSRCQSPALDEGKASLPGRPAGFTQPGTSPSTAALATRSTSIADAGLARSCRAAGRPSGQRAGELRPEASGPCRARAARRA